jgi:hypothetical protein
MLVSRMLKKTGPNENAVISPRKNPLYINSNSGCMQWRYKNFYDELCKVKRKKLIAVEIAS